ncbi:antifreeze protein [Kumtagia ephedrae]|jgi:hypothetical protein|uniref:Antifreeze protein n=1 Tax=Kumtagia ephedrae TaxID=2116701 RepID=A0A2P7RX90_9HYPH|nr:antifreeze protein [Mesorhizobium ephedrae]PSJ54838.1 antifreeze protein [Mesorhizobium ephedrae]
MPVARLAALAGLAAAAAFLAAPANALTMQECSAKYNAAKEAGTLGDVKWNDFRKSQCGSDDEAAIAPPVENKLKTSSVKPAAAAAMQEAKGLTMTECSTKYKGAQEAGVTGLKWNDFRKAECGPGSDPVALSTDGAAEPAPVNFAAPRGVTFPRGVPAKYAGETPAKARMRTCLDAYYANKTNDTLGGLKWVQKGGGYYSLCNTRLKG